MTQPDQSHTSSGPAQGDPHGASRPAEAQLSTAEPAALPKGWPLWVWPPVAVGLIAVAGYVLGVAGALTTAASTVATLIFIAGDFLYAGHRRRAVAIVAISISVLVLIGLMWQVKIPWIRQRIAEPTTVPGPVDLRGATVTQAQASTLNLRGAQLSGAILNDLVLRRKKMDGMVAFGVSFYHADLSYASLRGADLNGADFSYACLIGTSFNGADLNGANVNHATLNVHTLPASTVKTLIGTPVAPRPHQTQC